MSEKIVKHKSCKQCKTSFEITDKDLEFYDKVSPVFNGEKQSIPSPKLCPECRQQRRLSVRNEMKLYKRICGATGKSIISIYSPDKEEKVYNAWEWWSDKWSWLEYGVEFNFERSFFDQFNALRLNVPIAHRTSQETTMYNSDYCNEAWDLKDCYLSFEIWQSENCNYSRGLFEASNCADCLNSSNIQDSYFCIESINIYKCYFGLDLDGCESCFYCVNCSWSQDCFLSSNLVNKKYVFENRQYKKDQYFKKVEEYYNKYGSLRLQEMYFSNLHNRVCKPLHLISTSESTGDYLVNSKNCSYCYSCWDAEDCKYCDWLLPWGSNHNCMDITNFWIWVNFSYESQCIWWNPWVSSRILFSNACWPCFNLIYCYYCVNDTRNCFGCVWLKGAEYCILNKQYTKEEYNILVPRIIEKMKQDGEWGEFFPASISPFWYNETVAQEYFPLTKEEALEKWFKWSDYETPFPKVEKIIPSDKLPENITDTPDDILNWAIECEVTKKPFRIIKQELEFYRKHKLPIPKRHPDQRHLDRMKLRNPRKLYDRNCDKCWIYIKTTFAADRPEKVYCEACYNKEIY